MGRGDTSADGDDDSDRDRYGVGRRIVMTIQKILINDELGETDKLIMELISNLDKTLEGFLRLNYEIYAPLTREQLEVMRAGCINFAGHVGVSLKKCLDERDHEKFDRECIDIFKMALETCDDR